MRSANYTPQGLAGILCSRAEVYTLLGRGDEALSDLDRAWGLADGLKHVGLKRKCQLVCLQKKINVFHAQGSLSEMGEMAEKALELSQLLQDRKGEGLALIDIGRAHVSLGEYEPGLDYYQRSLKIQQEIGNRLGEAASLNNIGVVHVELGEHEQGLEYYHRSLKILQEIGDRQREAMALNNIGVVLMKLGEFERALEYHHRSLKIHQENGYRLGEAASLNNIGTIHFNRGGYEQARDYFHCSLTIRQRIGDRQGEATSLNNIGDVNNNLGEYEQALDYFHRSLKIRRGIGDRQGEATSFNRIGDVLFEMGEDRKSEEVYQKGEALGREMGAKVTWAYCLAGLARLHLHQGSLQLAGEKIAQLRRLADELKSREHQGISLYLQGGLHSKRGEKGLARAAFEESLAVFKELKNDLEMGKACFYCALGLAEMGCGQEGEAYVALAKEIFARLGAKAWLRKMEAYSGGERRSGEAPAGL